MTMELRSLDTKQIQTIQKHDDKKIRIPLYYSNKFFRNPINVNVLCESRQNCQCECVIKKVRNLLDELTLIERSQAIGVCEHCINTKIVDCKRCNAIINKFLEDRQCHIGESQKHYAKRLLKIRQVLHQLIDIYQYSPFGDDDLKRILKELDALLWSYSSRIGSFTKLADYKALSDIILETKNMLQNILSKCLCRHGTIFKQDLSFMKQQGPLLRKEMASQLEADKGHETYEDTSNIIETKVIIGDKVELENKKKKENNIGKENKLRNKRRIEKEGKDKSVRNYKKIEYKKVNKQGKQDAEKEKSRKNVGKQQENLGEKQKNLDEEQEIEKDTKVPAENKNKENLIDWTIRYRLSDPEFIKKKWTVLPSCKVMKRLDVYKTRPVPNLFTMHQNQSNSLYYDTGEILAKIYENNNGAWFYRNGSIALKYSRKLDEDEPTDVYEVFNCITNMEKLDSNTKLKLQKPLAVFDSTGNCAIYDLNGKSRLQYNQFDGMVVDPKIGPPGHWTWNNLNETSNEELLCINPSLEPKDLYIASLEPESKSEMIHSEEAPFTFRSKRIPKSYVKYEIKTKALKINEYFSLRILSQSEIYLLYRNGRNALKLNLGMYLDINTILKSVTVDYNDFHLG